jgi:hypothetical protein
MKTIKHRGLTLEALLHREAIAVMIHAGFPVREVLTIASIHDTEGNGLLHEVGEALF